MLIQQLNIKKAELMIKANQLTAIHKTLYSNVDIESPMSIEEKKLNSEISLVFSKINQIIKLKRSIKN